MRGGIDKRAMLLLATGHLVVDFANGALPALLPYFKEAFDLSYTLAALLMLGSTVSSSIVQPLFGLWSDRFGALWLLPGGVVVAGLGIAGAAAAPSYWLVLLLVVVSGLGVAAYHPEGSKLAAYASGRRRASGMSAFSIGGNVGFALGPLVAGGLAATVGLRGGLLLVFPCLAVAAVLVAATPYLTSFVPDRARARAAADADRPGALALLLAVIAFRSFTWFTLVTFVPLWAVELGHSKTYGNNLLFLLLVVGGIGTIAAGPAADRFGRRPVLLASLLTTPVFVAVFIAAGGVVGAAALALAGISVVGTFALTMVMSQEYLPRRIGLASGLSIGLSVGLGGVGAVIAGAVADAVDLRAALWLAVAMAVAAAILAAFLPSSRARAFEPELAPS